MKTNELREKYLEFYESKGHTRCASDVLVPTWDPSVLFTPAGMNPFKDHFLGKVKLDFTRATSCQKCLRTGDIENVGRTAYHHTFFEMLGNFSFGDYFKREAINWAWEFLTDKKWLGINPDQLSVTVYKDDHEAAGIWANDIGLPEARIERMDEDENFWPASAPSEGPDGVCGPCSEIYYHPGDGSGAVEIWNLVFTQFNRVGDPPDNLRPLPSKNIDTGMGLERTVAALQGVDTNYHIDILRPLVEAAAETCGLAYDPASETGRRMRRISDHVRACTFAVHENVYPGPNKAPYVIKRLLRRAVLDGHQTGMREPFLHQLVPVVAEQMAAAYPELKETTERVAQVIKSEEANFFATIDGGLQRVTKIFSDMSGESRNVVDGNFAFDLYQTYGFPPELFETLAVEQNFTFDWDGYREAMAEHGKISGGEKVTVMGAAGPIDALKKTLHATEFLGYESVESTAEIKGVIAQDRLCDQLTEVGHKDPVTVVLDRTPFYGESGGQVGDGGQLTGDGFRFEVSDTQRDGELVLHIGHLKEGTLPTGAQVTATVDTERRDGIRRAHSATHLLHHALQTTLGKHAQQKGSKVDTDWLRFDFSNPSAVTDEQLVTIEQDVRGKIQEKSAIRWDMLPLAEARQQGAMMLFGEKYPDPVRMVSMGDFSRELCGGTHLDSTFDVGPFEILSEENISAGTRRVVALTGARAKEHTEKTEFALTEAAGTLGVDAEQVPAATGLLAGWVRTLKKSISSGQAPGDAPQLDSADREQASHKALLQQAALRLKIAPLDVPQRLTALKQESESAAEEYKQQSSASSISADDLLAAAETVGDVKLVVAEAAGSNANRMRQLIDEIRQRETQTAVLLGCSPAEGKVALVAGMSRELEGSSLHCGNWIREVAEVVGGRGGGKPLMAQAGGTEPAKLADALETARTLAREALAS